MDQAHDGCTRSICGSWYAVHDALYIASAIALREKELDISGRLDLAINEPQ